MHNDRFLLWCAAATAAALVTIEAPAVVLGPRDRFRSPNRRGQFTIPESIVLPPLLIDRIFPSLRYKQHTSGSPVTTSLRGALWVGRCGRVLIKSFGPGEFRTVPRRENAGALGA